MALNFSILAVVIVLLPMVYLFLASPAFLLVRLDIPQVAQLLRTMFYGYFLTMVVAGAFGALVDAFAGHWAQAVAIALVAAFALLWRQWMMGRLDAEIGGSSEGKPDASRLRRLHVTGMAGNAAQLAVLVVLIPSLIVAV